MGGRDPDRAMKLWYDHEGDYLQVLFDGERAGHFRATTDDRVMIKVSQTDEVLGFSILGVSSSGGGPVEVVLP